MKSNNNFRHYHRVIDFMRTAESYCKLLDDLPEHWTLCTVELLPKLYSTTLALPRENEYETLSGNPIEPFAMTYEERSLLWKKLGAALREARFYWKVFDPTETPPSEPVCGDIADDLADIYRDIKPGLAAWQSGNDELIPDAIFHTREILFLSHWGPHLLGALTALHHVLYKSDTFGSKLPKL